MKRILLLCIIPSILSAQNILGVQNNSVIIRNTDHVGAVGDEMVVVRQSGDELFEIGKVKINRSVADMMLADITSETPGIHIAKGDQVIDVFQTSGASASVSRVGKTQVQAAAAPVPVHNLSRLSRRFRFGLSSGALIPYQVIDQMSPTSYHAGLILQFNPRENSAIMLDVVYNLKAREISPMLPQHTSYEPQHPFVFNVQTVFRHRLFGIIHLDVGAGGFISNIVLSADTKQSKIEKLDYYYGICGGLAFECISMPTWSLLVAPRYHTYYAEKQLVDHMTAGVQLIF